MAKKPTVTTVSSGYYGRVALNNNFTELRDGFDNTLSLDGSTPNSMGADLDLNSNDITNVGTITSDTIILNGNVLTATSALIAADAADVTIADVGGYYTGATTELALQEIGASLSTNTSDIADNVSGLALKAPLASPALTGTPTAPTAATSTDTTQIATTAFVQDAVGSAGAIVLLDSQTASSVLNLVFTAFDNATYGSYIFQFENLRPQTDDILEVRFSDDGGLNYAVGLASYEYSHISFATGGSVTGTADNTESSIILTTTVNGGIVGEGVNGEMRLFDPLATGKTNVVTRFGYVNGATDACTASGFGNRTSVEVTDAVRFFFQTGVNIAGGTIRMYGVKK